MRILFRHETEARSWISLAWELGEEEEEPHRTTIDVDIGTDPLLDMEVRPRGFGAPFGESRTLSCSVLTVPRVRLDAAFTLRGDGRLDGAFELSEE